jgi:hypothetical protein
MEARDFNRIAQSWRKTRKLTKRLIPPVPPGRVQEAVGVRMSAAQTPGDGIITFEHYIEDKNT